MTDHFFWDLTSHQQTSIIFLKLFKNASCLHFFLNIDFLQYLNLDLYDLRYP